MSPVGRSLALASTLPLTVRVSPIATAGSSGGIFSGVFKPECADALFQPWIQAFLAAAIEQYGIYRVHERFEMIRVPYGRAPRAYQMSASSPSSMLSKRMSVTATEYYGGCERSELRIGSPLNSIDEPPKRLEVAYLSGSARQRSANLVHLQGAEISAHERAEHQRGSAVFELRCSPHSAFVRERLNRGCAGSLRMHRKQSHPGDWAGSRDKVSSRVRGNAHVPSTVGCPSDCDRLHESGLSVDD